MFPSVTGKKIKKKNYKKRNFINGFPYIALKKKIVKNWLSKRSMALCDDRLMNHI